jgi:hypothetical protein
MTSTDTTAASADERREVPGIEYERAVAAGCGTLGGASLAAIPLFADGYRTETLLLAVGLFGLTCALGALGVSSVR